MHAITVSVTINDEEQALRGLREELVPRISQSPGFVTGYWTRSANSGASLVVFEDEDAANAARERMRGMEPDGVTIDDVQVREVVANA